MTKEQLKALKVGDKVRFIISSTTNFTKGKIYTVGGTYYGDAKTVGVIADDMGTENGWMDNGEGFELVNNPISEGSGAVSVEAVCHCSFKGLGHDLDCEYVKFRQNAI